MNHQRTAKAYLERVQRRDGAGAGQLFTDGGVIDDAAGGHHSGRAEIERFVNAIERLEVREVVASFEQSGRVTIFGRISTAATPDALIRWVFQFEGGLITHLGNSYVRDIPAANPQ